MTIIYDPRTLFGNEIRFASDGKNARFCCPCPKHNDRSQVNASFNMYTGEFYAYGMCGAPTFYKNQINKLVNWLREDCGLDVKVSMIEASEIDNLYEKPDDSWRERLLSLPRAYNSKYLNGRGVSIDIVEKFDLRHDINDEMIVYPIANENKKIVGANVRYTKRRHQRYQIFGEKLPLAGLDVINDNFNCDKLFITEGMFGQFNLTSFGYCSMSLLGSQGDIPLDIITKFDRVYACLDNDDGGYKLANKLLKKNPSIVFLKPSEYDEISKEQFEENLLDFTKQAISFNGINRLWNKS